MICLSPDMLSSRCRPPREVSMHVTLCWWRTNAKPYTCPARWARRRSIHSMKTMTQVQCSSPLPLRQSPEMKQFTCTFKIWLTSPCLSIPTDTTPFAVRDVYSRAAQLGYIGGRTHNHYYWERRNPNERQKKTGKKKKWGKQWLQQWHRNPIPVPRKEQYKQCIMWGGKINE